MSFLGGIVSAIGSVAGSLFGIGGDVAGGIGNAINGIASTVGNIAGAVTSSLEASAGAAFDALTTSAGDVFKTVEGGIGEAANAISDVIGPIKSFVDKTTEVVTELNDNVIKPITDTVLKTYTEMDNLIKTLHTDLHGGIKGLLAIPDAIANALTAVDAQLSRAMQELGLANKEMVTSTLLPGFSSIFAGPLGNIATGVGSLGGNKINLLNQIGQIQLASCLDASVFQTKLETVTDALKGNEGFVGEIGKMLMTIFWALPYLAESVKNDIECFQQGVNQKNPVALLGLGTIVKAFYRGILSSESAATEAAKLGLSGDRLKVLQEVEAFLPGPAESIEMMYRGVISAEQLEQVLAKQALSPDDVAALSAIFIAPVDPRENLQMYARQQAASANFLPESLGSGPPGTVTNLYPPAKRSPDQAKLDWLAHWKVPELQWWFTAWTRGMRTMEEFRLAAQAENIPFDVIDDMIPVFQEPIQLWMIPDMLGAGLMSDQEALAYLHYIGQDDSSALLMVKYGHTKLKAPAAAHAAELAGLSAALAKTMFDDGILDEAQYGEVLAEHGYSSEAVAAMLALAKQQLAVSTLKAKISGIVDQVNVGQMTATDAISAIYALGATDQQVDAAVLRIKSAKTANAKMPGRGELDDFLKSGVITKDQWAAGYSALGYSDDWIPIFLNYLEVKNGTTY